MAREESCRHWLPGHSNAHCCPLAPLLTLFNPTPENEGSESKGTAHSKVCKHELSKHAAKSYCSNELSLGQRESPIPCCVACSSAVRVQLNLRCMDITTSEGAFKNVSISEERDHHLKNICKEF